MDNSSNRFIVVDDDPMNNKICQFIINQVHPHASITLFNDGETALAFIKSQYDKKVNESKTILFLDLNMPVMMGWEFLDEFKKLSSEIQNKFQIYILSSSVDERDKERASREPLIAGFISKPISKDILIELS